MIPNITWGADFAGLVEYLVENRDHEVLDLQGVSAVEFAADEMAAVAALSHRAKNKLLHLSLSAAYQDGKLSRDQWLKAVASIERAFGLSGHQRVVVRHRDKTHDHVHVFWCTISLETGFTPPKGWFLKKGCAVEGIGPHALNDSQLKSVRAEDRARRTYDFRALSRCQDICRQLERQMGLRQLRTPQQAAAARLAGEQKAPSAGQKKRAERIGSVPLIHRADEIRHALDTRDWPSKHCAIVALGLDFEPAYRTTRNGAELRGLVIFDPADPANRMAASDLDTPDRKYGWRRLEDRHHDCAAGLEIWWPEREPIVAVAALEQSSAKRGLRDQFDLLRAEHVLVEREKEQRRKNLRSKQKQERAAKREALMRRRKAKASELLPSQRRAFYARFSREVSGPELAQLNDRHKQAAHNLARARAPSWIEFVGMCAAADDRRAAAQNGSNCPVLEREYVQVRPQEREHGVTAAAAPEIARLPSIPAQPIEELPSDALLRAFHACRGGRSR